MSAGKSPSCIQWDDSEQDTGKSLMLQSADIDFGALNLELQCEDILTSFIRPPSTYECATLINNAGSLGALTRTRNITASMIRSAFEVNVVAPFVLTSGFLNKFADVCKSISVINISSLAANVALEELLIQQEANDSPTGPESPVQPRVRVLNYAPGPLNTDMQQNIRDEMPDVALRAIYVKMHEEGKLVDPNDSARILVQLMETGNFENGAHIDYFDVLDPTPVGK
ncbi:hypothetical protein HDU67_008333 [Dinochytrium kinnereticum]|nr:hypothetical protein HDU67_008333 [Dinochytrium kinnereticum]